jgi:hypothetical protein
VVDDWAQNPSFWAIWRGVPDGVGRHGALLSDLLEGNILVLDSICKLLTADSFQTYSADYHVATYRAC